MTTSEFRKLLQQDPLYVFALPSEAAQEFDDHNVLICGIGKVNAAYHLSKTIFENRPSLIINLGSASSVKDPPS